MPHEMTIVSTSVPMPIARNHQSPMRVARSVADAHAATPPLMARARNIQPYTLAMSEVVSTWVWAGAFGYPWPPAASAGSGV